MRRIYQLCAVLMASGVLAACEPDVVIPTENIPTSGVRFLHASPDLGPVTFRFVDIPENSTHYNMLFRATANFYYKNARAGQRTLRVFRHTATGDQAINTIVLVEQQVVLEAGKRYTFILWGHSEAGATPGLALAMLEDDPADPGASIAMRVVNAAVTHGPLDVRHYPNGGTVPGAAAWASVAPMSATAYLTAAPGSIRINAQPAGGGAVLFADALALAGAAAPAASDFDAAPGTTVPGSAVSNIIVPRSVAGSAAANFPAPGMITVWDRRPVRGCNPNAHPLNPDEYCG